MAIVDKTKQRFDENMKADKLGLINALIYASNDLDSFKPNTSKINRKLTKKEKLILRLVPFLELMRKQGRLTVFGGEYEDGLFLSGDEITEEVLRNNFKRLDSLRTAGGEMGIWNNSEFDLNELAIQVADSLITVRRYFSVVFLNLFSFFEDSDGETKYKHFLFEILKYIEKEGVGNKYSKDILVDIFLFVEEDNETKKNNQRNILFDYLTLTEFFDRLDTNTFQLKSYWIENIERLKSYCNLEYEDIKLEIVQSKLNRQTRAENYAKYITSGSEKLDVFSDREKLISLSKDHLQKSFVDTLKNKPRQFIYFGAPGTGKSYQLNKDSKLFQENFVERVTFHPNMTYGQFVGVFKPVPIEEDKITYRYIPGAFMTQLVQALLHPENAYLLIIEELNRANVAAVFGDMFQLLDRKGSYESEYPINISEDLKYYFEKNIYANPDNQAFIDNMQLRLKHGLILPENLFIWTTMNSSDQGVAPMDTAFKRRWEQRYFGVNDSYLDNKSDFDSFKKIIVKESPGSRKNSLISWNDLRVFLNRKLTQLKVPEDKLIGPYFISKSILQSSNEQLTESFKSKVLMYLFEDAGKQRRQEIFQLAQDQMMYSELLKSFDDVGIWVFFGADSITDKLIHLDE